MILHLLQVRLSASLAAVALAARGAEFLPVKSATFIHLLAFAANFGMIFWVCDAVISPWAARLNAIANCSAFSIC